MYKYAYINARIYTSTCLYYTSIHLHKRANSYAFVHKTTHILFVYAVTEEENAFFTE